MSFIEYRRLLEKIGSSLEEFGITKLLYWCKDKIQAENQHNIHNVHALFEEMEANNTLGIDRLENLTELLRVLEKWRLFKEVRKFEIKRKKYNDLLQQISEALDESIEMERLISICKGKIPAEREGDINDTRSLLRELETQNNLEFRRLDILKEILYSVQKENLLREVEDFERWRHDEDESACRGGERAVMFADARSFGGRVFGVLTMKTICKVGAAGITLLTVNELLKRSDTCEQLMASFTACVLPAGTQLIDISQGCVCFTIKAYNLAALCTLWNAYKDGTLKLRVKKFVLTEDMIKLAGGEENNVEVTVAIEEDEYEKACFEFIREQEGAKPRKTIRRNSDSALAALPNEDEVSLVKMKQLENAFNLQLERIASLEKEVEMLPKLLFKTESPEPSIEEGKADQEFVEKNSDSCSTTSESSDSGLEGSVSGFEMEETVVSLKAFYISLPVIDLLCETLDITPLHLEDRRFQIDKEKFKTAVIGVRIEITGVKTMKGTYTVLGLSGESADRLQFDVEDETTGQRTKTTVAQYFYESYGIPLKYPHLPCLQVVGQKNDRYLPMEVCTIIPFQKTHLPAQQIVNLIKTSLCAPERRRNIQYWRQFGTVRRQPRQLQQQQVRPSGMQGMPGAGQVPRVRGIRQVFPRGVPGQKPQPGGPGRPSERLGGMGQPSQVRGGPAMQGQRPAFKFGQNVRNPPQVHPGAVAMQPQKPVQQTIHIPGQEPLNPSMLAAASPKEQKLIIGERLYPLIQSTHPDQAGKITAMLLEIENAQLLHMLESREALAAKTQEAVSVLRAHSARKKSPEI